MRHTRIIPLAAALALVAACSDLPTGASAPPLASADGETRPTATFDENTGCAWNADNTASCQFALSQVQDLPEGAKVRVVSTIHFGGDYVCLSTKSGKPKARTGGPFNHASVSDTKTSYSAAPFSGEATLTPTLPADWCPRGTVPSITGFVRQGRNIDAWVDYTSGATSTITYWTQVQ